MAGAASAIIAYRDFAVLMSLGGLWVSSKIDSRFMLHRARWRFREHAIYSPESAYSFNSARDVAGLANQVDMGGACP